MPRPLSKKQRLIVLYSVVAVSLVAGWTLYAAFGHDVIEAAYRGESIAYLNGMIGRQSELPLSYYVAAATRVMHTLTVLAIALCAAASIAIIDPGEVPSRVARRAIDAVARHGIEFLGPVFAVVAFATAAIAFFYPLEIETRESTVWLHVNTLKSGINLYDHTLTAFSDMNHGPLGPLAKFWIASLFPFLEPWQVVRFFVFLLPFVFLFVGWKLNTAMSGASRKQVLFLSSIGFVMLMVTAREFLLIGRSDATIAVLLLLALYASVSTAPRTVLAATLHGALAGLMGIAMVLTIWRVAPIAFGVFVFSIWRFGWVERVPKRAVWSWAIAYGLTCMAIVGLVILIVFHGNLRLYYGHFFSYFAATVGPGGKHYGGSVLAFIASLFNPSASPDTDKGGPLLLVAVLYAVTWGKGDATARGLKVLSIFALVACAVSYYLAWHGGGSWHFIPLLIILWTYLCTVQASIPQARLVWVGLCVVGLIALSAQPVVEPTLRRATRWSEATAFLTKLQALDSTHTVISEDLFFFRTKYHGELIDMGLDATLLRGTSVIDDAFGQTVQRHFDRLRSQPPEYIVEGIAGSPELEQLIRDKYVLMAEGPGNLTGNGPFASRLYRRSDVSAAGDM